LSSFTSFILRLNGNARGKMGEGRGVKKKGVKKKGVNM